MKRCISSSRKITTALVTAAVIFVTGSVVAQTVDQALQAEQRRIQLAQASQERINTVVEGTRSLEDQYRAINKEIDGLRVYNRLMTAQTEGQQAALDDIALSMDQVDVINRQIFPLMERMIDGLEQSIALDVPFLLEERNNRVATLKEIMQRSDVSVAEKFRKVMEAYQIENDYGSSSETYTQSLDVEGSPRNYNMLRVVDGVGWISVTWQITDPGIAGGPDTLFIVVRGQPHSQRAPLTSDRARAEFTTFRTCTVAGCPGIGP